MNTWDVAGGARQRLKLLGASVLVMLLAACGDHPPRDKDDDDDDRPPIQALSIVAGSATETGSVDATGADARFHNPSGVAIDAAGNLYVVDRGNRTIRKITPAGVVTTLAGSASAGAGFADGTGASARFTDPVAIAIHPTNGSLYVTDQLRIRSVNSSSGQVGTATTMAVGNNVDGRSMEAVYPGAIAVDPQGNLFMTNSYSTRYQSGSTTGIMEGVYTMDNLFGPRSLEPRGIALGPQSHVFVYDLNKTISRTGNINLLARLAGTPNVTGSADGAGGAASFGAVVALAVDPQENAYAADNGNNLVRKISPQGVVSTVAGKRGSQILTPGALPGSLAGVRGIATDGKGVLYVTSGQAVVKIILP
ncbi:hypothetical protein [Massilia sp. MS-15]|uniref:NHL domain-containing protein n=1 Tax=Massilia sp. MS-15 TaxID=2878200 RepID=UPI001CD6545E|nr:hypothetical protein [Massilia sp. MS-15]MCA1248708.1 hypothetical protein [Massilia sp. MS-15]